MKTIKTTVLKLIVLVGLLLVNVACKTEASTPTTNKGSTKDTLSITILQTADIHGQLDPHPELFWENEQVVFKNRGGLANIKTLFESYQSNT